jgi:hypothetical protein
MQTPCVKACGYRHDGSFLACPQCGVAQKPLETWSREDIKNWLTIDYSDVADKFPINGRQLAALKEEQITREVGTIVGAALFNDIQKLKGKILHW